MPQLTPPGIDSLMCLIRANANRETITTKFLIIPNPYN